ncbi:MAG: hypothetical protein JWO19_3581 [Bryobacterales bacterium]|nr:hypothetical protein [Bryobacterales bacterium]
MLQQSIGAVSRVGACFILFLGLACMCVAQDEERPITFQVGGGLTLTTGFDSGRLDKGGNFQAGAGHFFNRFLGIEANFMFNHLGLTRNELNNLGQPDGHARVFTVTLDPTLRIPLPRGFSAYLLVGGGWLRRTVEFTQPTLAGTFIFDPWWGYIGPALVPANLVLGSVTSDSGAYNVGGGINIPTVSRGPRIYIESRYVHGFTDNSNTTLVPITVGIRF